MNINMDDSESYEITYPDRWHFGRINYKTCPGFDYDENDPNFSFCTPKDVSGDHTILQDVKKKFYHNTRQDTPYFTL